MRGDFYYLMVQNIFLANAGKPRNRIAVHIVTLSVYHDLGKPPAIRKLSGFRNLYLPFFLPLSDLPLPAPLAKNAVVVYCPFAVVTYHRFNLPS